MYRFTQRLAHKLTTARVLPSYSLPDDLRNAISRAKLDPRAFDFYESFGGSGIYVIKGEYRAGTMTMSVWVDPITRGRYNVTVNIGEKTMYRRPFRSLDAAIGALATLLDTLVAAADNFTR